MVNARAIIFILMLLISASSLRAMTITMSKKTPEGQFSRTYFIEDKEIKLRTNSNYFESFKGIAKFGLFEVEATETIKKKIKRLSELSEALKKINKTLGDKAPKYNPTGERIWYVIDGMNVNQFHPYYEDFGKILNEISMTEKLSDIETISVQRTKEGFELKQSNRNKNSTESLSKESCHTNSIGTKCTIKGRGYAFFPL